METTKTEILVLGALEENLGWVLNTKHIQDILKIERTQARRAVRALSRKELAELTNSFREGDKKLLGTGYMITAKGKAFLEEWKKS